MNAAATRPVAIKIDDGIKAWEEYRATGLHVSADEADAWLAQLEQGNDIEPPECHV